MDEITLKSIKESLMRSGYLLENRVLNFFIANNYGAESSHKFFTNKEENVYQEIDVIVKRFIDSYQIEKTKESVNLAIEFVVECINNPVPLALFENIEDLDEPATDWATSILNGSPSLLELCSLQWQYCIDKYESTIFEKLPSRQYCSFQHKKDKSKDEWMACHPNDFHKTLHKLVQYTKHSLAETSRRWSEIRPQECRLDLVIPLIVLNKDILEIRNPENVELSSVDYYRLKVPFEYQGRNNLSIDIITEDYLQKYLEKKIIGIKQMFDHLIYKLTPYATE